jgi:hypothetical protein
MSKRVKGPAVENRRSRRPSGWHLEEAAQRAGTFRAFALKASRWDQLLRRHEIGDDETALIVLGLPGANARGRAIRDFARRNYRTRFVPEEILDRLGLDGCEGGLTFKCLREGVTT